MTRLTSLIAGVAILMAAGAMQAQTTMRLHMTDGTVHTFDYNEVDSLVIDHPLAGDNISVVVSDIKASSAVITVTSPDPDVRYYFDLCTADAYDHYNGNIAAMVEGFIADMCSQYPQLTKSQILDAMLDSGNTSEQIKQLPSETDMVVYIMPVDDGGKAYGKAVTTRFRTLEAGDPSKCTFSIAANDITSEGLTVSISPSDASVKYWYGLVVADGYPGDYAVMADVKSTFAEVAAENNMTVSELVSRVAYSDDVMQIESGLQSSSTYYIYAYALNPDASNAGPMTKIQFTTLEYDLSDAEVSLSYRYFDGNELYSLDPVTYQKYKDAVMVEAHVTPNDAASHWVVGLGRGNMTDETTYPDSATKQALLSGGGRFDLEDMTFVAAWGEATFLYFAADYAGVDGVLKRLPVDITREGASAVGLLGRANSLQARVGVASLRQQPSAGTAFRLQQRLQSARISFKK